jgi:hypothetical protein
MWSFQVSNEIGISPAAACPVPFPLNFAELQALLQTAAAWGGYPHLRQVGMDALRCLRRVQRRNTHRDSHALEPAFSPLNAG